MEIYRSTLRSQARDIVLSQILDGKLTPGDAINVSELADELGISRTPLREALVSLAEQGLVGIGDGNRGFSVWPLSLEEAKDLAQINGSLEALALRTTREAPPERIERLRALNEELERAQGKPRRMMRFDDLWHETLIAGSENKQLRDLIAKVRSRFHRYRWYGYDYVALHGSDEKLKSVDQHAAVVDALEAAQRERAAALIENHWNSAIELLARWLPKRDDFPPG